MRPEQREKLLATIVESLVRKLNTESPAVHQRLQFVEDLMAAELRHQQRGLG